jgi:hypothetical protein
MRKTFPSRRMAAACAVLLAGTAAPAMAQDWGGAPDAAPAADEAPPPSEEAGQTRAERRADRRGGRRGGEGERKTRVDVTPYLEVGAIMSADLKNGGDVLTYSTAAVGVDANIATQRAELAASVRYERRFGLSDSLSDQDVISGLVRGRYEVARGFNLEAGALASRTRADNGGGATDIVVGDRSNVANVYSVYAGPTLTQQVAGFDVGAGYRFGYTKVDVETPAVLAPGAVATDIFDSSTNHAAWASVGQRPGRGILPFGWQISGGWEREDASQLDQRYDGKYVRADVTMPITPSLSVLGGVGYEDIEISQRDALRDAAGNPVRDASGRLRTDPASARQLAFDVDGLIWDAGVMWQPSRRTSVTAKVGRRYGDMVYTGSLSYKPNHATLFQLGVYDGLSSFGRSLSGGLAALPTQFDVSRNPIDGSIGSCAFGAQGSGCLTPALGSAISTQFRNRGVQALLSSELGGWNVGVGGGYDRRRLLTPAGSTLAALNGITDENYYAFVSVARALDQDSDLSATAFYNYFDNGVATASDVTSAGATVTYSRRFWRGLTGTASAAINSFDQDGVNSQLLGSALLGLRYNF